MTTRHRSLLLALFAVGCGSTGVGNPGISQKDQRLIDDGTTALEAGDTSSSLSSLTTLALRDPAQFIDPATVATLAQQRTPLYFQPADCLVTSRDAATVTFTFDGCRTGAFGLVELSGELVATYSVEGPSSIGVSVSSNPSLDLGATEIVLESENFADSERRFEHSGRQRQVPAMRPERADIDHTSSYVGAAARPHFDVHCRQSSTWSAPSSRAAQARSYSAMIRLPVAALGSPESRCSASFGSTERMQPRWTLSTRRGLASYRGADCANRSLPRPGSN